MPHRPKDRPRPGGKPGATHEQVQRRERGERARRDSLRPDDDTAVLYGWHTVKAALENPQRRLRKLLTTDNAARRLADEGVAAKPPPEIVRPDAIAAPCPDAVHQGIYAGADPLPQPSIELAADGVVLVLDQRWPSAQRRRDLPLGRGVRRHRHRHHRAPQPGSDRRAGRSASGALETCRAGHRAESRALATLKERGFLVVGLDAGGEHEFDALPLRRPLALVLGAEGKGLRQLTKETCDHLARFELSGAIREPQRVERRRGRCSTSRAHA